MMNGKRTTRAMASPTIQLMLLALSSGICSPAHAFQPLMAHRAQIRRASDIRWNIDTMNLNRTSRLYGVVQDIESQAKMAADTWSIEVTSFLEPDVAKKVDELFQDRADVVAFRVVGGRRMPSASETISSGEGRRSRFVFVHPELGLDIGTAESEYCTVILVENVNLKASNTLPNALAGIGVNLDQVGDIVVTDNSTVYMVVDPTVAKQCLRLLSKELVGVGISLSLVDEHEFMPDGEIQEMKLSRILERKMDRKKYEKGYVQFS
ncbi:hypothetical protein HJC23_008288 [Cyclotella cryptica]|uniref:Uncharacterized protein n=1 Tax=Cyclotella cryptica TaxID=29204 RepID=A0ABD3PCS1_9STRA